MAAKGSGLGGHHLGARNHSNIGQQQGSGQVQLVLVSWAVEGKDTYRSLLCTEACCVPIAQTGGQPTGPRSHFGILDSRQAGPIFPKVLHTAKTAEQSF